MTGPPNSGFESADKKPTAKSQDGSANLHTESHEQPPTIGQFWNSIVSGVSGFDAKTFVSQIPPETVSSYLRGKELAADPDRAGLSSQQKSDVDTYNTLHDKLSSQIPIFDHDAFVGSMEDAMHKQSAEGVSQGKPQEIATPGSSDRSDKSDTVRSPGSGSDKTLPPTTKEDQNKSANAAQSNIGDSTPTAARIGDQASGINKQGDRINSSDGTSSNSSRSDAVPNVGKLASQKSEPITWDTVINSGSNAVPSKNGEAGSNATNGKSGALGVTGHSVEFDATVAPHAVAPFGADGRSAEKHPVDAGANPARTAESHGHNAPSTESHLSDARTSESGTSKSAFTDGPHTTAHDIESRYGESSAAETPSTNSRAIEARGAGSGASEIRSAGTHSGGVQSAENYVAGIRSEDSHSTQVRSAESPAAEGRAAEIHAIETHAVETHAALGHAAEIRATEIHSAEVRAAQNHSTELHSSEPHSAELHSAETHAPAIHSAEIHSAEVHAAAIHSAEVHAAAIHSAESLAFEVRSAETRAAEAHQSELRLTDTTKSASPVVPSHLDATEPAHILHSPSGDTHLVDRANHNLVGTEVPQRLQGQETVLAPQDVSKGRQSELAPTRANSTENQNSVADSSTRLENILQANGKSSLRWQQNLSTRDSPSTPINQTTSGPPRSAARTGTTYSISVAAGKTDIEAKTPLAAATARTVQNRYIFGADLAIAAVIAAAGAARVRAEVVRQFEQGDHISAIKDDSKHSSSSATATGNSTTEIKAEITNKITHKTTAETSDIAKHTQPQRLESQHPSVTSLANKSRVGSKLSQIQSGLQVKVERIVPPILAADHNRSGEYKPDPNANAIRVTEQRDARYQRYQITEKRYITGAEIALAAIIAAVGPSRIRAEMIGPTRKGEVSSVTLPTNPKEPLPPHAVDSIPVLKPESSQISVNTSPAVVPALDSTKTRLEPRKEPLQHPSPPSKDETSAQRSEATSISQSGKRVEHIRSPADKLASAEIHAEQPATEPAADRAAADSILKPSLGLQSTDKIHNDIALNESAIASFESQQEENPSPPHVVHRIQRLISVNDTLVSIAEDYFHDPNVAWLIADLNLNRVKETWLDGKRIIGIKSRQTIELPVWEEIRDFLIRRDSQARADNLITIVDQTSVDKELLDSNLGKLLDPG